MQHISIEQLKAKAGERWLELEYVIERSTLRRFVQAVGDDNPMWQGDKAEIPPSLLPTLGFEKIISLILDLPYIVLHGSTEIAFFDTVKPGDTITVTVKISGIRERPPVTFISFELEQHNQHGKVVALCKQLALLRGNDEPQL